MAQPGTSQTLYRSVPAGGLPPEFGPSVDEYGNNVRRLATKMQEELRKQELVLPDSGPQAPAPDGGLVLPGSGPDRSAPTGPMSAEGIRSAMDAHAAAVRDRAAAQQQGAFKARNDASFGEKIASSYGANAAARDARRQEARTTGLNTDPAEVAANARAATEQWRDTKPFDSMKDFHEREDRAAVAQDTAEYNAAYAQWKKTADVLAANYNVAVQDGDREKAAAAAAAIAAHNKARPVATERMTGGLTPQEVKEPVHVTFAKLSDAEKLALAKQHNNDQDTITAVYADLEPEERVQVMRNDAARIMGADGTAPDVDVDFTPGMEGEGMGDNAPGRTPKVPRQLKGIPTDRDEPGVRGGPYVQNPDGSVSSRAFSPDQMAPYDTPEELNPNPQRQGPEWVKQMKAAGVAMNMDPKAFDNEGAFIGAVQKKLAEYQRMAGKYDATAVATGGYRWVPKPDTKAQGELQGLRSRTRDATRQRSMSTAEQAALEAAFDVTDKEITEAGSFPKAVEDARRQVRDVMQAHYSQDHFDRGRTYRDSVADRVYSQRVNDPNYAPGMLRSSLQVAGTDPAQQALVYRQFGMPREAARIEAIDAQRAIALSEKETERARIAALGDKEKKMLPADAVAAGTRAAISHAFDPELGPDVGFASYMATQVQADEAAGIKRSKDEYETSFAQMLIAHSPDAGFNMSVTQRVLENLAKKADTWWRNRAGGVAGVDTPKDYFVNEVARTLGDEAARRASEWWDSRRAR